MRSFSHAHACSAPPRAHDQVGDGDGGFKSVLARECYTAFAFNKHADLHTPQFTSGVERNPNLLPHTNDDGAAAALASPPPASPVLARLGAGALGVLAAMAVFSAVAVARRARARAHTHEPSPPGTTGCSVKGASVPVAGGHGASGGFEYGAPDEMTPLARSTGPAPVSQSQAILV